MDFALFVDVLEAACNLPGCIECNVKVIQSTMSVDGKPMAACANERMTSRVLGRGCNLSPENSGVAILAKIDIIANGATKSWRDRDVLSRTAELAIARNLRRHKFAESRHRRRSSRYRRGRRRFWQGRHEVKIILNVLFQIQIAEFHIEKVMCSPGKPSLPENPDQVGMSAIAQ
jgi:hypothetical protein